MSMTFDSKTMAKLRLNLKRNRSSDHSPLMDAAADAFCFADHSEQHWNPIEQSLLFGTPLWEAADSHQRMRLNQLYWVAYYAQIIKAEVATIFFNAMSATGLYQYENYRSIADILDLESSQERAHINTFRVVSDAVEEELFGRRIFTSEWGSPFSETMLFPNTNAIKRFYKRLALRAYGHLSSGSAFIASQYLTVRGLRTLNGKMVQQTLSDYFVDLGDAGVAGGPAAISHYHYMDESYHFNSSRIVGIDVVRSLPKPTAFERFVANAAIDGCQRDHQHFSVVVNGLFWYEPATFPAVYALLKSPLFGFDHRESLHWMERCFCEESEAVVGAFGQQQTAAASYSRFLEPLEYITASNQEMRVMNRASIGRYLSENKRAMQRFSPSIA